MMRRLRIITQYQRPPEATRRMLYLATLLFFSLSCQGHRTQQGMRTPVSAAQVEGSKRRSSLESSTSTTERPREVYLCPEWAKLGPRFEFLLSEVKPEHQQRFGSSSPFSVRLPGPSKPAPWWLSTGLSPSCKAAGMECWHVPFRMFEREPQMQVCGKDPAVAPLRAISVAIDVIPENDAERNQPIDEASMDCLTRAGRVDDQGQVPEVLSRKVVSLEKRTCITEASGQRSWLAGQPPLHYYSLLRFRRHPRGYLQKAVIVFVVDEPDWPTVADIIRDSAESFEVDWARFERHYTSQLWDHPSSSR